MSVRDIWHDDRISIFDTQIIYPFCKSSIKSNADKTLESRENEKKTKCVRRCKKHKLNFTPCIATTNAVLGDKFNRTIKNIAKRLELK